MKRCPTCQRTYTDDSLSFCLQDGSLLLSEASVPESFDPNATLHLPAKKTGRDEPPPTEVLRSEQTLQVSAPPASTVASPPPRTTMPDAPEGFSSSAPARSKPQSTGLIVGLTVTVVVLLLALGSVGAWMLLRDDSSSSNSNGETKGTPSPADNQNSRASQTSSNGRATASASPGATPRTPAPSPSATATTPPVDTAAIRDEVTATLNGWAAASMAHDIEKHMSYYADTLDTYYASTNVSASRVRADRERAYAVYSTIDIRLSNIKVTVEPNGSSANATFDKTWSFEGSKYSSGSVRQRISLTNTGGRWLITGEKDLQVYYVNK
jgi:ketosteroid isomerase-like protein